jgi:hypothetical protein
VFTNDDPLNSTDPLGMIWLDPGPQGLPMPLCFGVDDAASSRSGESAGVETSGTNLSRQLGLDGESLAGIDQAAKQEIDSLTGTANFRIPDELSDTTLLEVKNVRYLSLTSQLRDFTAWTEKYGLAFDLVVRVNTVLSKSIVKLVEEGVIKIIRLLPRR